MDNTEKEEMLARIEALEKFRAEMEKETSERKFQNGLLIDKIVARLARFKNELREIPMEREAAELKSEAEQKNS